jgi:hypothetical protein
MSLSPFLDFRKCRVIADGRFVYGWAPLSYMLVVADENRVGIFASVIVVV